MKMRSQTMTAKQERKGKKQHHNRVEDSKNETQLGTATQPSSPHSAARPRSAAALPLLASFSPRTALTSLQTSCLAAVPAVSPKQAGLYSAAASMCLGVMRDTSLAAPNDDTLVWRLAVSFQGPPPHLSRGGERSWGAVGEADAIPAHIASDTCTGGSEG